MDPVSQAYTEDCFSWKCVTCGLFAKDKLELEMQFIENEKIVLSENDNTKWVCCDICLMKYHLKCITSESEVKVAQDVFVCTVYGLQVNLNHIINTSENIIKLIMQNKIYSMRFGRICRGEPISPL